MCVNNCGGCSSCLENLVPIPVGPQGPAGPQGIPGAAGANGAQGVQGPQGLYGGYSMEFNFNTLTGFPAISGRLQVNNVDWTLSSQLIVNNSDINGEDASSFLTSFVNDGNYGYIKVFKSTDSSVFILGKVTNVFISGSYSTISYTYISSNGVPGVDIINNDNVVLSFVGNGAAGLDSEVINNDFTYDVTNSLSPTLLKQDTIPVGLLTEEDVYVVEGTIGFAGGGEYSIVLNSTDLVPFKLIKENNSVRFKVELNVVNNTTILAVVNVMGVTPLGSIFNYYHNLVAGVTVNNLASLSNVVNVIVKSASGNVVFSPHLVTYKFKK